MKSNLFLGALLVATAFTLGSCNSSGNEDVPDAVQKTAQVQLTLKGTVGTRATGTQIPTQSDENTIIRYTVVIFNSDANTSVNAIRTFEGSNTMPTLSCTPAQNCTGIVVANAPSDNYFAGVSNKADFLARTITLADAQTSTNLPMSGQILLSSSGTFTLSAGNNTGLIVSLSRLVARVSISSIKTDFNTNGQYANASFKPTNIFIRNAQSVVVPNTGDVITTTPSSVAFLKGNYSGFTSVNLF